MMKLLFSRVAWGILLITGGVLFLLQNLGLIDVGNLFWGIVLGFAGIAFLSSFFFDRRHWWPLIPGFTLLALALMLIPEIFAEGQAARLGGSVFLGGIGLGFFAVYLAERSNWWAIIPGGVLLTLATVAGLEGRLADTGAVFFLGLGLTFILVAIFPTPDGPMRWAFIPAGILLFIGLLIMVAAGHLVNLILPIALIVAGLYLLIRTLVPRLSR
jgi:hypothetical protein